MKKSLLRNGILLVAVLFTSSVFAQDWVKMMQDPTVNFYDVQKAFNEYNSKAERQLEKEKRKLRKSKGENLSEEEIEVPGYAQYKRWEWYHAPRVSSTGERFSPDANWKAMEAYRAGIQTAGTGGAGSWTALGPSATSGMSGAGRLNMIRINPTNSSTIYACSPAGGLWTSTTGGSSWTTNTDQLPSVIGCSDIAFDPNNASIMYMATGDGEAGDNNSVGLLKSTNGGTSWSPTGLSFNAAQYRQMSRVVVDPTNGNNIYVATSAGVYRSMDAAATFTLVQTGSFKSLELKPGTPSTIYACGTEFYYSTNSGTTWTKALGFPAATALSRMSLAVSANNPTTVYVVAGKVQPNYGMDGFYKSTNSGANFAKVSTPPVGSDNQQWYDLPIAANPTNALEVMIGGQLSFLKSSDGGGTWSAVAGSTHVDYHGITYDPNGSTVYIASDGGAYKSLNNGSSWSNINNNLSIAEMYGFGHSASNANLLIAGHQDNGTNIYNGSWNATMGGDGMLSFISWGNNSSMWCSQFNGSLEHSTNGGGSWPSMTGITESCPWVTEWNEDPLTAGTVYAGCESVWKASGTVFSKLTGIITPNTPSVTITAIAVSPVNAQIMWVGKGGVVSKSVNGGTSWTAISALPPGTVSDIICHPTDVNKAWVSMSGFSAANKVFQTTDQGTTWTNLSASIPNVPVNCMAIDKNGNDAIYIGTDVGCFFKDASMTIWQPFSNQLPNVIVTQLEMFYAGGKIRASTYGRGLWESTLYQTGPYPPDANFSADKFFGCPGLGVQFTDYSAGSPNQWSWVFPGGNPATSTVQNPFVAYNTPGTYSVSLTAYNANGNDVQTFTNYVTISPSQAAPTVPSYTICGPVAVALTATPAVTPGTVRWWNQAAGGTILATGNTYNPTLWGTQTLYVDESFPSANIDFVGATNKSMGAGNMFTASDIRGLYFDVYSAVIINSVKVYAQTAGIRTIEIVDANGNLVTDTTLNIPASATNPATVTINRTVYPGTNYFIKFRGSVNCYRNSSGASYPYVDNGSNAIAITNSNAGSPGYYYFFYDWQFTNIVCNTGRTPVYITDNCSLTGINDLFVNNQLDIFPNPNTGLFAVSFHAENVGDYTVKVTNAVGQTVYEEKLENFSGAYSNKIDITSFQKGVYLLSVSNPKNETVKKVLVY